MVIKNTCISYNIVNSAEDIIRYIFSCSGANSKLHAMYAYIKFKDCRMQIKGLPIEIVTLFLVRKSFKYASPNGNKFNMLRKQLPILPTCIYTDYKSQGRSLETVIIDLANIHNLQSIYVMLSRVKSLVGLEIL